MKGNSGNFPAHDWQRMNWVEIGGGGGGVGSAAGEGGDA